MSNTPNVVLDAVGNVPNVGDRVVFAPARRGAQEFVKGVIVKVNSKSVTIEFEITGRIAYTNEYYKAIGTRQRSSGCFVIVKENS